MTVSIDGEPFIQLWTHHPTDFPLDDPSLRIDHTRGEFWRMKQRGFRYRDMLPILSDRLGTDQFIWCCTKRGKFQRMTEEDDLVEWELNVPAAQVLAVYRVQQWEDIVWSRSDNWEDLIHDFDLADYLGEDVGALVRVPLPARVARRHEMKVRYPKGERA